MQGTDGAIWLIAVRIGQGMGGAMLFANYRQRLHRPFAAGLILVLVGITYGLLPYGYHNMGWTSP